jgi:transposase
MPNTPTKHKLKVKDLRQTILCIRTHTYPYKQKEPNKTDFTKYNIAQINEITDILEAIRDTVDLADQRIQQKTNPIKGPGRPRVPAKDVLKVLLMETYFGISDRIAEGYFNLFREKLGISSDFCYKTIEQGYDPERSKELINEVLKITNEVGNANESDFSIDGTGDPCTMKINYESKRAEQRREKQSKIKTSKQGSDLFPGKKHDFQYSVFTLGRSTKIIGGFETTDDHRLGEMSFFKPVVEQTIVNCPGFRVLYGDGAYANRVACGLLAQQQITPFLLPMSTVTFRSHGVPFWKSMLYSLVENPQRWLESYHNRSMSESVNSMLKRRMAGKVRKKLSPRKAIAEALKFMVHNIRQICYLKILNPKLLKVEIIGK